MSKAHEFPFRQRLGHGERHRNITQGIGTKLRIEESRLSKILTHRNRLLLFFFRSHRSFYSYLFISSGILRLLIIHRGLWRYEFHHYCSATFIYPVSHHGTFLHILQLVKSASHSSE